MDGDESCFGEDSTCGDRGGGAVAERFGVDALATLINLVDVPATVYAAVRGTAAADDRFTDISGAASITLQFSEDRAGVADVVRSDGGGDVQRDLL